MNKVIKKKNLFEITNKYYSTMKLHDMLLLYFKILDIIYPNYVPKLNNNTVFTRLYSSRKPPYRSCCTSHSSMFNLQKNIKSQLKTDYDKKQYYRTCLFFKHFQKELLNELIFSYTWLEFSLNLNFRQRNEIILTLKKRLGKWNGINDILKFNRKGKITKIIYDFK